MKSKHEQRRTIKTQKITSTRFSNVQLQLAGKEKCKYLSAKAKAVPLHATTALGRKGGVAPTHSRHRH
jgi:hypothetical protein